MVVIPANPALGETCAICLNKSHDGRDLSEVYSKPAVCQHTFHRECIRQWFTDAQGECPLCRRVHENVDCHACNEPGDVVVCSRCPEVYHLSAGCLGSEEAHRMLRESASWCM